MSYRHKGKWRYSSTTWYEMEANGQFHDLAVLPPPQDIPHGRLSGPQCQDRHFYEYTTSLNPAAN